MNAASQTTEAAVERARQALHGSAYPEIRQLRCVPGDGGFAIEGRLPTYFLQQQLQRLMQSVAADSRVAYRIEVPFR